MSSTLDKSTWRSGGRKVVLAWLWFFLILFAYYLLKPVRDGLATGHRMDWLFWASFIGTAVVLAAYTQIVSLVSPKKLVVIAHQFFAACLLSFIVLFKLNGTEDLLGVAAFFVWVGIFSVFTTTMFWSIMAEQFSSEQGKLWFGTIAAGGSVGSVVGSIVAIEVSKSIGPNSLLIIALIVVQLAMVIAYWCLSESSSKQDNVEPGEVIPPTTKTKIEDEVVGGTIYEGLVRVLTSPYLLYICLFVAIGKFAATFVYNNLQDTLATEMPSADATTILFSKMNLYSQGGSLFVQAVLAGLIMKRFGVITALVIPCVCVTAWFGWLGFSATLTTLVVGQVGQQILGYGLLVPAQQVLYTVVSREDKYKSKAFTDTVVFRGSDAVAASASVWLSKTGFSLGQLAFLILPISVIWGVIACVVGVMYRNRANKAK